MQPNLHGVRRDSKLGGDCLGGHLLDVAKHEDDAVGFRQRRDGVAHRPPHVVLLEKPVRLRSPVGEVLRVMAVFQIGRKKGLDGFFRLAAARPQLHQRRIHDDPVEPGRELAIPLESPKPFEGRQKRALDDIARVFVVPYEPSCHGQHPSAVVANHQLVCGLVAAAEPVQQGGVIKMVHTLLFRERQCRWAGKTPQCTGAQP